MKLLTQVVLALLISVCAYSEVMNPGNGRVIDNLDGTIDFLANESNPGVARFEYTIIDEDGQAAKGWAYITIEPAFEPPVAVEDHFHMRQGEVLRINVAELIENDTHPQDKSFEYAIDTEKCNYGVVWFENFELGRLLSIGAGPGIKHKHSRGGPTWTTIISGSSVNSGQHAVRQTIKTTDGQVTTAFKVFRVIDDSLLPDSAYYSTMVKVPIGNIPQWANILSWATGWVQFDEDTQTNMGYHDPSFTISVNSDDLGQTYYLVLHNYVGPDGTIKIDDHTTYTSPIPFPPDTQVQVECGFKWSKESDGFITCWQDGEEIFNIQDTITEYTHERPYVGKERQWIIEFESDNAINGDLESTVPQLSSIYFDDMAISLNQLGPECLPTQH